MRRLPRFLSSAVGLGLFVVRHKIDIETRRLICEPEQPRQADNVVVRQRFERGGALQQLLDVVALGADRLDQLLVRVAVQRDDIDLVVFRRRRGVHFGW
jgi:hypothetical protein